MVGYLRAIIGRDGHVHGLRPVSSPGPDLTISAIAAVRQWTYKPYLLNGEPTEVDTTITVNYNLNRF
jgi:outer membrane biosynthesis protein TonB